MQGVAAPERPLPLDREGGASWVPNGARRAFLVIGHFHMWTAALGDPPPQSTSF